jgi:hypothetical protein
VSYNPAFPDVFIFVAVQEVLVAGQPNLAIPFYMECDLFVDISPSSLFPIPTSFGT